MFLALEKLGLTLEFIDLVRLLFKNAEAAVCLNGSITRSFRIKRGVRQGCPLPTSSYLLWSQDLPPNFKLRWKDIWVKCKARKESSFLWSLWYQALVVNSSRMKIDQSFQVDCPSCDPTTQQTTTHQFWNCPEARTAREFAINYPAQTQNVATYQWCLESTQLGAMPVQQEATQKLEGVHLL
jgi:hypothetical protein